MVKREQWTETHRREARARLLHLYADAVQGGATWGTVGGLHCLTDRAFRSYLDGAFRFDAARIDREVRRVRGLADGGLVRETGWRGTSRDGSALAWTQSKATARRWRNSGAYVVRVTRIRKATP